MTDGFNTQLLSKVKEHPDRTKFAVMLAFHHPFLRVVFLTHFRFMQVAERKTELNISKSILH